QHPGQGVVDHDVLEPGDGEAGQPAGERRPEHHAPEPSDEPTQLLAAPAHQTWRLMNPRRRKVASIPVRDHTDAMATTTAPRAASPTWYQGSACPVTTARPAANACVVGRAWASGCSTPGSALTG